jgi:hypothetical protein
MGKQRRNNSVTVKYSDEELMVVRRHAALLRTNRTKYIYLRSLEKPDLQITEMGDRTYEVLLKFHREFNAQGVNLNQLARAVNRDHLDGFVKNGYLATLIEIRDTNRQIAAAIGEWRK